MVAGDETGADTQLVRGEATGLFGSRFANAIDLEENVTGLHNGYPNIDCTFTFTLTCFRWLAGDGLVWEDTDPDLAFTLEVTVDRNTASFDLPVGDPAALERLETELAEVYVRSACSVACTAATLGLTELGSAGH